MTPQHVGHRRLTTLGAPAVVGYLASVLTGVGLSRLSDAGWWTHLGWAVSSLLLVVGLTVTTGRRLVLSERSARWAQIDADGRVEQLAEDLSRAAQGDLRVDVASGDPSLDRLRVAFNGTLEHLRALVTQVRGGGEQLAASAGQLLTTAEEHAASAAQQSSAVTETTSTIEQLAATAAQIAETADAVSLYAARTLRYAEEGRSAVMASVESMDKISTRVDALAERALVLGGKSHEIGTILSVIDDLSDQTNLLAGARRSPPARSRRSSARSRPRRTARSSRPRRARRRCARAPRSRRAWSRRSSGSRAWSTRPRRPPRRSPSRRSSNGPPRTRSWAR